ncbi:SPT3 Dosage dependent suppressor of Ty-induced promoter mutations-like protein, partial [Spiromyces aspiralis]
MPKDPASIPGMSKSPGSTTKLYQSYQTTRPSPLSKNVSTGVDMFSFLQQANGASPSTAPGSGYNSVQVSPLLSASQPGSPSRAKAPPNAPNRMGANNLSGYGSHLNLFGLGNGGNSSSSAVAASTSAVGVPDLKSPGLSAMAAQLALNGSNGEGSNPPSAAQSANASPNTAAHRRHLMNSLANFSMTPLPPTGPLAAYNPPVSFAQYGQSAAQGISVTVPGSAYHPIASSAGQGMQTSAGFANTLDAYINTSLPQTTQQGPSAHTDAMAAAMAAAAAAVAASAGPSRSTTATVPVAGRAGTGAYLTPAASADISQEIAKVRAQGLKLQLEGIPENAKSRVETQIKLTLRLLTSDGVPVTCWSHLQLPELLVSREKFRHRLQKVPMNDQSMPSSEQQIVHLEAKVICSNKPTYKIETCLGCIRREYKRSLRRKENRVRSAVQSTCTTPNQSRPSSPTGELLSLGGSNSTGGRLTGNMEVDWDANRIEIEKQRIIIFNCNDLLDFSKGEVSLPTRITCYCRHHGEKIGFCVCLTLKDWKGEVLATTISPPIMITDDHKSTKFKQDRKTRNKSEYDRLGADLSRILPAGGVAPASIPAGNLHVVEGTMGPYKGSRQTMSARNSPSLRPRVGLLDSYSQLASLAGTPSVGNTPIQSPMLGAIHGPNDLASLAAASALSSGSITPHGMINPALSQVMSNPSQLFAISAALGSHGAYNAGSSLNVAVAAPSVPQAQPAGGPSFTPIRRRASTNLGDKAKSQPAQQQPLVTGAFNPSIFNLDGGGGMSLSGSVSHTPVFSQTLQNAQASMHAAQQQQRQNFIPQISQTLQGMSKS